MNISLDRICEIARAAGGIIMGVYNGSKEDWDVSRKGDNSPLTLADQRANDYICKALKDSYPDIPIVSEENKAIDYEERKGFESFWLVDPLDGTKEFIKRNGEFTVNIALVHQGSPTLGVIYAPVLDRMFFADAGKGAWEKTKGAESKRLHVNDFSLSDQGLRLVCSRSHLSAETESFVNTFNQPELKSMGSSLKMMLIASGEADIYPRLAPTMEWDTGAADAILKEAGGLLIRSDTLRPIDYNSQELRNPFFLAIGNCHEGHLALKPKL